MLKHKHRVLQVIHLFSKEKLCRCHLSRTPWFACESISVASVRPPQKKTPSPSFWIPRRYVLHAVRTAKESYWAERTLYLRWRATRTLRSAKGLSPRNVVCCFSWSNGISNNSLAMHSSAKEFETTLTPVKSRTTLSFSLMSDNNFCLSFWPMIVEPKSVP